MQSHGFLLWLEQEPLIECGCSARLSFDSRRKFYWCLFYFERELGHPPRANPGRTGNTTLGISVLSR